jgi:hypothetical protein
VLVTSIRQQAVPDRLLGRASSAFRLFRLGPAPVGSALAGVIAQVADVRPSSPPPRCSAPCCWCRFRRDHQPGSGRRNQLGEGRTTSP